MKNVPTEGSLQGIRVVDLTKALAGPYCTMMLGDFGAEVWKVEPPGKGDDTREWGPPFLGGESAYFLSCNRNKKSLAVNLKDPKGLNVVRRLAAKADVFVENGRPGSMERLGLGYAALKDANPRLIYASISGFGATGPDAAKPGYDLIAQGRGGFMGFTGEKGGAPTKVGVAVADINAGMFCAFGIVSALFRRQIDGRGQKVETSLLEGQVAQLTFQAGRYFATGQAPQPMGNDHPSIAPYASYRARDGMVNIAVGSEALWEAFCAALGRPELAGREEFATNAERVAHRDALRHEIEQVLASIDVAEVRRRLDEKGVPNGPIAGLDEVLADPQVLARDMVCTMDHPKAGPIRVTGVPVKLSDTPGSLRLPPPLLGQHTSEVLRENLGASETEIQALAEAGVIALQAR